MFRRRCCRVDCVVAVALIVDAIVAAAAVGFNGGSVFGTLALAAQRSGGRRNAFFPFPLACLCQPLLPCLGRGGEEG